MKVGPYKGIGAPARMREEARACMDRATQSKQRPAPARRASRGHAAVGSSTAANPTLGLAHRGARQRPRKGESDTTRERILVTPTTACSQGQPRSAVRTSFRNVSAQAEMMGKQLYKRNPLQFLKIFLAEISCHMITFLPHSGISLLFERIDFALIYCGVLEEKKTVT